MQSKTQLDRKSPVPLYFQLYGILSAAIRDGTYQNGAQLPTEVSLVRTFSIGRPTVRQAIDQLEREGLVERVRGAGTFVKAPCQKEVQLFSLGGTLSAFETAGVSIHRKVPDYQSSFVVTGEDSTNPFNGIEVVFATRVTYAGEKPVVYERIFLDKTMFNGVDVNTLKDGSLGKFALDKARLRIHSARQTFRCSKAGRLASQALGLQPDSWLLRVDRSIEFFTHRGKPGVFTQFFTQTNEFAFSQVIKGEL